MLVVDVDSKCFLIPGLLVWTLVWVGSVRCWCGLLVWAVCGLLLAWALVWVDGVCCWRGMSKLWRGDRLNAFLIPGLLVWVVGVDVGVGCWCGMLAWDVEVVAWRSSSTWNSTTQSMF